MSNKFKYFSGFHLLLFLIFFLFFSGSIQTAITQSSGKRGERIPGKVDPSKIKAKTDVIVKSINPLGCKCEHDLAIHGALLPSRITAKIHNAGPVDVKVELLSEIWNYNGSSVVQFHDGTPILKANEDLSYLVTGLGTKLLWKHKGITVKIVIMSPDIVDINPANNQMTVYDCVSTGE